MPIGPITPPGGIIFNPPPGQPPKQVIFSTGGGANGPLIAKAGLHPDISALIDLFHRKKAAGSFFPDQQNPTTGQALNNYSSNIYAGIPGMENYTGGPAAGFPNNQSFDRGTIKATSDPWAGYPSVARAGQVAGAANAINMGGLNVAQRYRGNSTGADLGGYADYLRRLLQGGGQ